MASFAQWRYSNQWSNREVLLLLVENYTQYPALSTWNIVVWGNFCRLLREQLNAISWFFSLSFSYLNTSTECAATWILSWSLPASYYSDGWFARSHSQCILHEQEVKIHMFSGEVSRSRRYCNAWPTRDKAGASSWTSSPYKNQFNIEESTWLSYQILSW